MNTVKPRLPYSGRGLRRKGKHMYRLFTLWLLPFVAPIFGFIYLFKQILEAF
jgi:paraquat-inducible protein B